MLKEKGLWEEFNMLNSWKIKSEVLKGEIDEVKERVDIVKDFRLSLKNR